MNNTPAANLMSLKAINFDYLDEIGAQMKNVADLLSDSCVAFTRKVTCWSQSVAEKRSLLFDGILFLISSHGVR